MTARSGDGRGEAGRAPRPSWVVIPARDEADEIEACLEALRRAADQVEGATHLVVVDDRSTDATAALARTALGRWGRDHAVLEGRGEGVGWARRLGLEHALSAALTASTRDALIATTDADSCVAPDWLAAMHRRLDHGHVVVAGDVLLAPQTDPRLVAARAVRLARRLEALPPDEAGAPHPHFAGGNLGFDARTLERLGPLPTPRALEDHAILERCRELGIPVLRDAAVRVVTSGRTTGRAPQGLADALALDLAALTEASGTPPITP